MFLATGVGHSGTGWFSKFMTEVGYPCTHEKQYSLKRSGPLESPDSSWLAVPYLNDLPQRTPVVHLVRDPVRVLNSMLRTNGMKSRPKDSGGVFDSYSYKHLPQSGKPNLQLDRLMTHITHWDAPINEYQGPVLVVRIGEHNDLIADNWDPFYLCQMVEFCTGDLINSNELLHKAKKIGRVNDHGRGRGNKHSWDTIPGGGLRDMMRDRSFRYGFLK